MKFLFALSFCSIASLLYSSDATNASWGEAKLIEDSVLHAPSFLPERITLTWDEDPAKSQRVSWRTNTTVQKAFAEISIANDNGRALKPKRMTAQSNFFQSDINSAHYHTVSFKNLEPNTLYVYRLGDGVNWTEYFHFKTANSEPEPFSFIYLGDAQNEIKTHWSRVFREAFRESPYAAFTLHAGDLVTRGEQDALWGEWHAAGSWVNATIPMIASPGNHEYYKKNPGPSGERFWNTKAGEVISVDVQQESIDDGNAETDLCKVRVPSSSVKDAYFVYDDNGDKIIEVGAGIEKLTGFSKNDLKGTEFDKAPLKSRPRLPGTATLTEHWRQQFVYPVQDAPEGLEESCYFIDYQGTRIISLNSCEKQAEQSQWLEKVLKENPQRWTIITFHHPIFSPAKDRDNKELRKLWKPVFDKYKVDLVLNGHDHTYARTGVLKNKADGDNVPTGYQQAYDPEIGTVYVVSVSGPKMYDITKGQFSVRTAEDTQLYQVIDVRFNDLQFKAYTATGVLYDSFILRKREGQANKLMEVLPPENRN